MTLAAAIFLVSAGALGLELVLVRALSISHWYHFAYLVISTALLGFGAGGILVSLQRDRLVRHHLAALWASAVAFGVTVPAVFVVSQQVPFDQLQLMWDRARQWLYLLAYYLLFFVPFFCAGTFVALSFAVSPRKAWRVYFCNMTGSAAGAAAILVLMYGRSPQSLLLVVSALAFAAAALLGLELSWRRAVITAAAAAAWLFCFSTAGPMSLAINISQQKPLAYYSKLPGAETIAVRYSPIARLDCIKAPSLRHLPGASLSYEGTPPRQIAIIADAAATSFVVRFQDPGELDYCDYLTSALPYRMVGEPNVCIIGAGGGSEVVQALALGARQVTAVEVNPQVVELVRGPLSGFCGRLYDRSNVDVVVAEGRNFLQSTRRRFDIIVVSLPDSYAASAAGLSSLHESHLYTVEAVQKALTRLTSTGLLSVNWTLKTPPRDSLKLLATIAEALRRLGVPQQDLPRHLAVIRGLATGTVVAGRRPLPEDMVAAVRRFARSRRFDVVCLPELTPEQVNLFNQLQEGPIYYRCAMQVLSDGYADFYRQYPYHIRPATDDRPYFFDFFKWKSLPDFRRRLGHDWLRFSQWGHLLLVLTLAQALLASLVFILLPLGLARPVRALGGARAIVIVYFLLLGVGYMFLEMAFIQKMTMLLGQPVLGVAITLVGFLFFSGLGALAAGRFSAVAMPAVLSRGRSRRRSPVAVAGHSL